MTMIKEKISMETICWTYIPPCVTDIDVNCPWLTVPGCIIQNN
jgi:hypothetical protein